MKTAWKVLGLPLLVFLFFSLMSRIDFIVHNKVYYYGLRFSHQWANEYWIVYCATFYTFSLSIGFMYWLGSNKNKQDTKISLALITSMALLFIGGATDIMFFVLWVGKLPPENVMWWWMHWYCIFGVWTTSMQLILTAIISLIIVLLWVQTLRLRPVRFVKRTMSIRTWIRQLLPTYATSHGTAKTADKKSRTLKTKNTTT